MIGIDVQSDIKATMRHLDSAKRKQVPKATSRAINRSITKVRTETRRNVSMQMGLPQKRIKDSFVLRKANSTMLVATLLGTGRPIKLIYFKGTRQLKRGVKSKAYGVPRLYQGTFISTVGNGHRGVFKRKSDRRLPIRELYGPGVPQAMAEQKIQQSMRTTGFKTFRTELHRQLTKVL